MTAPTDRTSEFGRTLRTLRTARGWSRASLAYKAEVSEATVARLELYGAQSGPSVTVLQKLAAALDVPPGDLLASEDAA